MNIKFELKGKNEIESYMQLYIPIQKKYIDECSPKEKSDYVIDNNDYVRPYLKEIQSL